MIKKLKNKICSWIRFNCGIYDLINKQTATQKHVHLLDERIKTIEETIKIGVDVAHMRHDSWAVICINGQPEYVKFLALPRNDIREIRQFLQRYAKNAVVDAPPCARRFLDV